MDFEIYKYSAFKRFLIRAGRFFKGLGTGFVNFFINLGKLFVSLFVKLFAAIKSFGQNFVKGNILTKASYLFMGLSHLFRGQIVRGFIYFILEVGFICYMVFFGGNYLSMFFQNFFTGGNVGRVETSDFWNEELGIYDKLPGDNSFHIILYGILTLFVILFFIMTYFQVTKESYDLEQNTIIGKKPANFKWFIRAKPPKSIESKCSFSF